MATILVVDDHAMSRQVLKTLFGYLGHHVLEAADGSAALALARSEPPDLVISDILMPTMDGVEFVRGLRDEDALKGTPVIFYTATYRMPDAIRLGQTCGVTRVIPKPSDPVFILKTVNEILGLSLADGAPPPATDQLYNTLRKSESFQSAGLQLAAIMDLSLHMVSQRDPTRLMSNFCRAAQDIMHCECSTLALLADNGKTRYFNGSNESEQCDACPGELLPLSEILDRVVGHRSTLRRHQPDTGPEESSGCGRTHRSLLALPIASPRRVYGWICFADKLGGSPFSDGDEEIGVALSTQAAVAYENILLWEGQRRHAAELETSNAELETANKELAAFVYSVSHDLKAPLRSVSSFAKAVIEDYSDKLDAGGRDYLHRIDKASDTMIRLIDDLLHLSKISRQEIAHGRVDLSAGVSSLVAELRRAHPERNVKVEIKEGVTALADHGLMKIVLANLIENAWKFTSKKESAGIEFGSIEKDGKTVFYVKDNGAGFDPTYADKMFMPFRRLHSNSEFEGTGIGLAIVDRIIRRHDGRVWAEGEIGKGATIYFTLGREQVLRKEAPVNSG